EIVFFRCRVLVRIVEIQSELLSRGQQPVHLGRIQANQPCARVLQYIGDELSKRLVLAQTGQDDTDRIEGKLRDGELGSLAALKQLANLPSPLLGEQQFQPDVGVHQEPHQSFHHSSAFFWSSREVKRSR